MLVATYPLSRVKMSPHRLPSYLIYFAEPGFRGWTEVRSETYAFRREGNGPLPLRGLRAAVQ